MSLAGSLGPRIDQEGHESPHDGRHRKTNSPRVDIDVAASSGTVDAVRRTVPTSAARRLDEGQGAQKLHKDQVIYRFYVGAVVHIFLDGLVNQISSRVSVHGSLHADDKGSLKDKTLVPAIHGGITGCVSNLLRIWSYHLSSFGIASKNSENRCSDEFIHQFGLELFDKAVIALGAVADIYRNRSGTLVGGGSQLERVSALTIGDSFLKPGRRGFCCGFFRGCARRNNHWIGGDCW